MAKYNKRNQVSEEVVHESSKLAKANQKPGQTKEQTKLIAQGIQKGIEQYKKQHKAKVREQDKQRKKRTAAVDEQLAPGEWAVATTSRGSWLPWLLLILSWLGFGVYLWLGG